MLSFSRFLYVEFVSDMKLPTLIQAHKNAFAAFGGWPKSILYDNMKQVKIGPDTWNSLFLDFATYYDFTPKTHRIRRPRTKGKVERMVSYVRDSFLKGRSFADFVDLNAQAQHWLAHVANVRIHATTQRRPVDLWAEEKLTPLTSMPPYVLAETFQRTADKEGFVSLDGSRYSVPPTHACQKLTLLRRPERIVIMAGTQVLTEHIRAGKSGECIAKPEHLQELWKISLGTDTPPYPSWSLTFDTQVQARPLTRYEEVA